MRIFLVLISVCLYSCSNIPTNKNSSILNQSADDTVEISAEKSVTQNSSNTEIGRENREEFSTSPVKANRNKEIALYIGAIEDSLFQAIGVLKWLERNGYRIISYYTAAEETMLLSHLQSKKKTSYLEWSLHQCCKEDFPLESKDSYLQILKKQSEQSKLDNPVAPQEEGLSCLEYSEEHSQYTVLCMGLADKETVSFEIQTSGMDLIKMNFAPVKYEEKSALVDYIDKGYDLAKKIRNKRI